MKKVENSNTIVLATVTVTVMVMIRAAMAIAIARSKVRSISPFTVIAVIAGVIIATEIFS